MAEKTSDADSTLIEEEPLKGSLSTTPVDPMIGKVIDNRYRILALVAQGGMGRVYHAEQAPLGRIVALKVLDNGKTPDSDKEMRQRFMLEAAACARLNHPNTIRIFDYGRTWDDVLYISMEFIQGKTLHHVIRQDAPLALDRVVSIARQICGSLREAHAAGLIHRDLKPSNVMLTRHGDEVDVVKVLDFGLVRQLIGDSELTHADSVVGSPSYMSPEQIRGERLDQRSDIYSLGVLLYACLAGKTPFAAESAVKVMMAHLNTPPPPLSSFNPAINDAPILDWTIQTCLQKDPARRFASIDELLKALKVCTRQLRREKPPMPELENGRVLIAPEWISSSSIALPVISSGSISKSSLAGQHRPLSGENSTLLGSIPASGLPWLAIGTAGMGIIGGLAILALVQLYFYWSNLPPEPAAAATPAALVLPAQPAPEVQVPPEITPPPDATPKPPESKEPKKPETKKPETKKPEEPEIKRPDPTPVLITPTPAPTPEPTPAPTPKPTPTPSSTGTDLKPWGSP
jgi:serine/threonine-protein kinase